MLVAPLPINEEERIRALNAYRILDTEAEAAFDQLAFLASQVCRTPIALVSLVDEKRQWFKSTVGLDAKETPRDHAFCAHAILQPEVFTVPDAKADARFADNPLVTGGPYLRAYAGAPLVTSGGQALGTICVLDREAREFTEAEKACLQTIAAQAIVHLELRRLRMDSQPQFGHAAGLLAAISHELRTPLNGLVGATEMLGESELAPDQRRWVELAQKSTDKLLAAIDQVLSLGQRMVESGLGTAETRDPNSEK